MKNGGHTMNRLKDFETTARIKLALITHANIGGLDIAVETVNGIVVLTGYVQDAMQKDLASEIAQSHGGLDIKNDIQVLSEVAETETLMRRLAEKPEAFASEDVSIRQRILGNLEADARVNALMVNIDEVSGTVRLSGIQESQAARQRAEEIAYRVAGVSQVINEIEVRAAPHERAA